MLKNLHILTTFCTCALYLGGGVALFIFVSWITGKNYKSSSISVVLWILIIAYSIMAFLWQPAIGEDLPRYFSQANEIRASGLSLFDFVTQTLRGVKNPIGGYGTLYTFNFIRYIIHYISDNNHWLPCIFIFTHYAIWHYITLDWFKRHNFDHKWLILVMMTALSMASLTGLTSGVRNGFAGAITALALYWRIYRKKSLLLYFTLSLIAATIHPGVLISVGLGLIYPYVNGTISLITAISVSFSASRILKAFAGSSNAYLLFVSSHFSNYFIQGYYDLRTSYYSRIVLVILILCMFLARKKCFATASSKRDKSDRDMNTFVIVYLVASLSARFIGIGTVLYGRMLMILSPLSGILVSFLAENKYKKHVTAYIGFVLTIVFTTLCLITVAYSDGGGFFKRVLYLFLKV